MNLRRRRTMMMFAAAALGALAAAAGARPARAYVRYRTGGGAPFAWSKTCLGIIAYPAGLEDMMPADQVMAAATAAASAWSAGQVSGTALDIQVAATDGAPPDVAYDGQSSLIFRRDSWCKASDEPGTCSYNPAALALTSVFSRSSTGEILDGDIEVNAKLFLWSDLELASHASAGKQDLQNALTHEVGHFIGLDHPCVVPGAPPAMPGTPRPVDNLGDPVPDCDAAPAEVMQSTMFPSAVAGDLEKRTLSPDDELAAREIYPAGATAPAACAPPEPRLADPPSGCAVAGGAGASGGAAAFGALLAWGAARRPGRRRKGEPTRR